MDKPRIVIPMPGVKKVEAQPQVSTKPEAIKATLTKHDDKPSLIPTVNILTENEDAALSPNLSLKEKIAQIESYMAEEGELPIAKLRAGCKDVMTCIKAAGDDIMELQPSDIRTVVQGYIATASQEVKDIVLGKAKKTATTQKRAKAKEATDAMKRAAQLDLDGVDL